MKKNPKNCDEQLKESDNELVKKSQSPKLKHNVAALFTVNNFFNKRKWEEFGNSNTIWKQNLNLWNIKWVIKLKFMADFFSIMLVFFV